jgi:hypothetical protein
MNITVYRYSDNGDSTLGLLFIDGKFECYTLEDEGREVKIKGETRIPDGIYEVKLRKEESPLTASYRLKYPWFKWHLQVMNVPNFNYVYIHIGNLEKHTDACLLVGDQINNNEIDKGFLGKSAQAFKRIYTKINKALDNGETIKIRYRWMSSSKYFSMTTQ